MAPKSSAIRGQESPTPPSQSDQQFLVGWVCMVWEEFLAATSVLDAKHDFHVTMSDGDDNDYTLGQMGNQHVVINCPASGTMGQFRAHEIASKMRSTFPSIRVFLLVGIGGGVPSPKNDVRLGDVVVGNMIIPYREGKATDDGFKITGKTLTPRNALCSAITHLHLKRSKGFRLDEAIHSVAEKLLASGEKLERPEIDRLLISESLHEGQECECQREGVESSIHMIPRPPRQGDLVMLHAGSIGSADQVLKNARERDQLSKHDIMCVEMEAIGTMRQTNNYCLSVRGISDYADGHKNDGWRLYAAMAAAVCAKEILGSINMQLIRPQLTSEELAHCAQGAIKQVQILHSSLSGGLEDIDRFHETLRFVLSRCDLLEGLRNWEMKDIECNARQLGKEEIEQRINHYKHLIEKLSRSIDDIHSKVDEVRKETMGRDERGQWGDLKKEVEKTNKRVKKAAGEEVAWDTAMGIFSVVAKNTSAQFFVDVLAELKPMYLRIAKKFKDIHLWPRSPKVDEQDAPAPALTEVESSPLPTRPASPRASEPDIASPSSEGSEPETAAPSVFDRSTNSGGQSFSSSPSIPDPATPSPVPDCPGASVEHPKHQPHVPFNPSLSRFPLRRSNTTTAAGGQRPSYDAAPMPQ